MNKSSNTLIGIGYLIILMIGGPLSKAQTVNLNDSEQSGMDEIKAALKVEQRNYDNLISMLKGGTSADSHNRNFQESWLRWINSRVKEIGKQSNEATSLEKLLGFIRNRSESISVIIDYNKRNEQELLNQGQNREKMLTTSSDIMLELLFKNLATADYPIDVHPEEVIKNNEGLKKVEDVP